MSKSFLPNVSKFEPVIVNGTGHGLNLVCVPFPRRPQKVLAKTQRRRLLTYKKKEYTANETYTKILEFLGSCDGL